MIFETDNTIDPEDLCHNCHKSKISDELTGLCSECFSEFAEAMCDTATEVDEEIRPDLTSEQREAAFRATGADYNVSSSDTDEYVYQTFIEPQFETEDEDYDDEDYDDEEEEEDIDDDEEEEEEDLLVDHYGEDLTREEREELMMKDIEKAQDKSEY